ncbi:NAD(P)H-quinone oxidoreductase subunit 3 [Candidatus Bathyarchaeota archaeon]|nr:NAD(P)H-quinone oxidoreductase subunit 3 [Candidatus Bathyarchaeota archaeon]
MVFLNFILSLPFIFLSALLISSFLYLVGSKIAPKVKGTKGSSGKLAPYACGEDMPARKFQVNIRRFFLYVTYFMIFDILAFMLALSFSSRGIYPILFSAIIALSLLAAIAVTRRKRR